MQRFVGLNLKSHSQQHNKKRHPDRHKNSHKHTAKIKWYKKNNQTKICTQISNMYTKALNLKSADLTLQARPENVTVVYEISCVAMGLSGVTRVKKLWRVRFTRIRFSLKSYWRVKYFFPKALLNQNLNQGFLSSSSGLCVQWRYYRFEPGEKLR